MSLFALTLFASAQAAIPVLVVPFEGQDQEADRVALEIPSLLAREIENDPSLAVLDVDSIPAVGDQSAWLYLDSCPPGQLEGCAYVVGEKAGAAYALVGSVRTVEPTTPEGAEPGEEPPPLEHEVELRILDVKFYNEVLSVVLVYSELASDSFADAVPMMLQDAAQGWVGAEVDIRSSVVLPKDDLDEEEAASELDALKQELGEVEGQGRARASSDPYREDRPVLDMEGLTEGTPPTEWERLGLSPQQYLSWWNSGWDYASWSRRLDGRRGQLLLRGHAGAGLGPTHGLYYGREAYRSGDAQVLEEVYATHELASGLSSHVGLSLGFGLLETLELEAGASREGGRYGVDARYVFLPEGTEATRESLEGPQGTPQVWLGARWVPLPWLSLRPVVGLGAAWWFGHSLDDAEIPAGELPAFTAPVLMSIRGLAGAELRVSPRVDLFLQAPIHLLLAGTQPVVYDDQKIEGEGYGLPDKREPARPVPVAASLQLGAQLRLGRRRAPQQGPQLSGEDAADPDALD